MQDYILRICAAPKIVTDVGTNFISEKFKNFCMSLNIHHSKQWTSRSIYKIYQKNHEKCYETKALYIYIYIYIYIYRERERERERERQRQRQRQRERESERKTERVICTYAFIIHKIDTVQPKLPSPATLLINRPSRGILPRFSRLSLGCDNDVSNHSTLINRQPQEVKILTLAKVFLFYQQDQLDWCGKKTEDPECHCHGTVVEHESDDCKARATKWEW